MENAILIYASPAREPDSESEPTCKCKPWRQLHANSARAPANSRAALMLGQIRIPTGHFAHWLDSRRKCLTASQAHFGGGSRRNCVHRTPRNGPHRNASRAREPHRLTESNPRSVASTPLMQHRVQQQTGQTRCSLPSCNRPVSILTILPSASSLHPAWLCTGGLSKLPIHFGKSHVLAFSSRRCSSYPSPLRRPPPLPPPRPLPLPLVHLVIRFSVLCVSGDITHVGRENERWSYW